MPVIMSRIYIDCKQSKFRSSLVTLGKDSRELVENLTGVSIKRSIRIFNSELGRSAASH